MEGLASQNEVNNMARRGWYRDPARHSLAARGVGTRTKMPSKFKSASSGMKKEGLWKFAGKKLKWKPGGPGKFEGTPNEDFAEALYEASLDMSWLDDEVGSVAEIGYWYGLMDLEDLKIRDDEGNPIVGVIVHEDASGFFDYETYSDRDLMMREWEVIARMAEMTTEE